MDEEATGQEAVEAETETPETEAPEPVVEEEAVTEEGEGEEEEAPEEVEFDLGGGQKIKVAADATAREILETAQRAFKDVEANTTRKNQDVAERAKSVEAREKAVERISTLSDQVLNEYARGRAVQAEIEQLAKEDVNRLWQSPNPQDRDRARQVSDRLSRKQAELAGIVQSVSQLEGEQSKAQAEETARRMEEGKREVERRIPGFIDKHANEVVEYAVKSGVPKEQAGNWAANPVVTEMAWKAMQFDRIQQKAKQAAKPKPPEAQPIQPSKGRGGKPNLDLVKDADKMSADEWLKRRNAQLRA